MNGINDGYLNQFLSRRLNITDAPAPAGTLAPEIMPVIDAKPASQEDEFLRGVRMCAAGYTVGAAPASYTIWELRNPATSRMLVMLDTVMIFNAALGGYQSHYLEQTDQTTYPLGAFGGGVRDSRWGQATTRTAALIAASTTPNAPPAAWYPIITTRRAGTDVGPHEYNLSLTIIPGCSYYCITVGANEVLNMNMFWRERPGQPSELG